MNVFFRQLPVIILLLLETGIITAQNDTGSAISLDSLYGDIPYKISQPLNPWASTGVILPDTRAEDWPAIREKMHKRISHYFGTGPVELKPAINKFEEMDRYKSFGLVHIKYRYQIVDDIWSEAILVLPEGMKNNDSRTAILAIHGTNGEFGKMGMLDVTPRKNLAYGIELAKRGYITFSPDLFGYGSTIKGSSEAEVVGALLKKYPDWSYRGIKLLTLIRALDVLEQLPFVKKGSYGSIGLSLGGGMGLFHAAFDTRIKASVPSAGVSPASTNVFRLAKRGESEEPEKWKKIAKDGKPPYDIQEIIALCAPRAMLFTEPFNDPYNPDVLASVNAVYQAMQVYNLMGTPGRISILIHGDGHETMPDVRDYAYKWLDRFLLK